MTSLNLSLLAAAKLAEAAWLAMLMICWGAILLVILFSVLGVACRSRILACLGFIILIAFSLYIQPWLGFTPFEAEAYEDPDVVAAARNFKEMASGWVVAVVFSVASIIFVILTNRRRGAKYEESDENTVQP